MNTEILKQWSENQNAVFESIQSQLNKDQLSNEKLVQLVQNSNSILEFQSSTIIQRNQFAYQNNQNRILFITYDRTDSQVKLCLNSQSIINKKDFEKFNIVLLNSLNKCTIEPETYYNSAFELLVNPNDDTYIALLVKRLFHTKKNTDYSNIQLSKVQHQSRENSQLFIIDVFLTVQQKDVNTLNFFKLETQAMRHRNYISVFWHPLAGYPQHTYQSAYLCLLTSQQEKSDQYLHIVDCNASLLSCYTSINITQSQKASNLKQNPIVDATISKNSNDLNAISLFLLDSAGSIYYICPLLLKNMIITQDLIDTIHSRKDCQELSKLIQQANFIEIKPRQYLCLAQGHLIYNQGVAQIHQFRYLRPTNLQQNGYCVLHKSDHTKGHLFILARKNVTGDLDVQIVFGYGQLKIASAKVTSELMAYEIYNNTVKILYQQSEQQLKPIQKYLINKLSTIIGNYMPVVCSSDPYRVFLQYLNSIVLIDFNKIKNWEEQNLIDTIGNLVELQSIQISNYEKQKDPILNTLLHYEENNTIIQVQPIGVLQTTSLLILTNNGFQMDLQNLTQSQLEQFLPKEQNTNLGLNLDGELTIQDKKKYELLKKKIRILKEKLGVCKRLKSIIILVDQQKLDKSNENEDLSELNNQLIEFVNTDCKQLGQGINNMGNENELGVEQSEIDASKVEQLKEKLESLNQEMSQNNEQIMEKLIKMEANYGSCSEMKSRTNEYKKMNNRYQRLNQDYDELENEYKEQKQGLDNFIESKSKSEIDKIQNRYGVIQIGRD